MNDRAPVVDPDRARFVGHLPDAGPWHIRAMADRLFLCSAISGAWEIVAGQLVRLPPVDCPSSIWAPGWSPPTFGPGARR